MSRNRNVSTATDPIAWISNASALNFPRSLKKCCGKALPCHVARHAGFFTGGFVAAWFYWQFTFPHSLNGEMIDYVVVNDHVGSFRSLPNVNGTHLRLTTVLGQILLQHREREKHLCSLEGRSFLRSGAPVGIQLVIQHVFSHVGCSSH